MRIIKNGEIQANGNLINCLACKSVNGCVLEPMSQYNIYYCYLCIMKAFEKARKEN